MKQKFAIAALVFVFMFALGGLLVVASDSPTSLTEEQAVLVFLYWRMLEDRGHFILDGTVVDEAGKPVPDFSVDYSRGRSDKEIAELDAARRSPDPAAMAKVYRKQRQGPDTVRGKDGRFHIDVKNAEFYTFSLRFHARGYYDAKTYMEYPLSIDEYAALDQAITNRVVAKEAVPREILVKKTFKVVMRKKTSKPATVKKWNIALDVMRNNDRIGFEFPLSKKKKEPGPIRLSEKDKRRPPQAIFLSVKYESKGGFQIGQSLDPVFHQPADVPIDAKIVMNSESGDGFVRYERRSNDTGDSDVHYRKESIQREMGMAPEGGYQLELPFSGKDLLSMSHMDIDVVFFFKCGGRYGRARCTGFAIEKDRSALGISLTVELQPDGSRNLETGE